MGMFDYIKCEYPLPLPGFENVQFQTKDTPSQFMETYRITPEGRLMRPVMRYGTVPEDERPLCKGKPPEQRSDWDKAFGSISAIKEGETDTEFHGDFYFYGGRDADEFVAFVARFTDGTIQWVKQTEEFF